jgi:hypothetical protein
MSAAPVAIGVEHFSKYNAGYNVLKLFAWAIYVINFVYVF